MNSSVSPDWSTLVPELLSKIFALLSNDEIYAVSGVCKRWNDALKIPELWTDRPISSFITDESWNPPKKFCEEFGPLIQDIRILNYAWIFNLKEVFNNLRSLHLGLPNTRNIKEISTFICEQKNLRRFSIDADIQLTEKLFDILAKHRLPLEQIEWSGFTTGHEELGKSLKTLQKLINLSVVQTKEINAGSALRKIGFNCDFGAYSFVMLFSGNVVECPKLEVYFRIENRLDWICVNSLNTIESLLPSSITRLDIAVNDAESFDNILRYCTIFSSRLTRLQIYSNVTRGLTVTESDLKNLCCLEKLEEICFYGFIDVTRVSHHHQHYRGFLLIVTESIAIDCNAHQRFKNVRPLCYSYQSAAGRKINHRHLMVQRW